MKRFKSAVYKYVVLKFRHQCHWLLIKYGGLYATWPVSIINFIVISEPTNLITSEHGETLFGHIHQL
jgi:hypothetical protein